MDHIIVRYGEISNKGNNRSQLERMLVQNIQHAVSEFDSVRVSRVSGRAVLSLHGADAEAVLAKARRVFGIQSLSPVVKTSWSVDEIAEAALELLQDAGKQLGRPGTFKVEVRRGNKQFPYRSPEFARDLGGRLLQNGPNWTVDVHHPDLEIQVDIRDAEVFVFGRVVPGIGGLPVGMSGKALLLLSGGIDSPVAGWKALKRGMSLEAVHFHSYPFTSERAREKVNELASVLGSWGRGIRVHHVSLTEIQGSIAKHCPVPLRTVMMRRMMFRIAEQLAAQVGALGLITGDSVGQVASQTLESIHVVDQVVNTPVLRPLLTDDKTEIIQRAKDIGTYELSILPYDDCCSIFAPKSPRTRPNREEVERGEENLPVFDLVQNALVGVEVIDFS